MNTETRSQKAQEALTAVANIVAQNGTDMDEAMGGFGYEALLTDAELLRAWKEHAKAQARLLRELDRVTMNGNLTEGDNND